MLPAHTSPWIHQCTPTGFTYPPSDATRRLAPTHGKRTCGASTRDVEGRLEYIAFDEVFWYGVVDVFEGGAWQCEVALHAAKEVSAFNESRGKTYVQRMRFRGNRTWRSGVWWCHELRASQQELKFEDLWMLRKEWQSHGHTIANQASELLDLVLSQLQSLTFGSKHKWQQNPAPTVTLYFCPENPPFYESCLCHRLTSLVSQ